MDNQSRSPALTIKFSTFYKLWLKHIALSILTISWSRFFTKTQIRKYIWSNIQFDGESFEYTGKGIDLLKGFLKAMMFFLLFYPAFFALEFFTIGWINYLVWALGLSLFVFFGSVGYYGALRYRLSRTNFRGIFFSLQGSSLQFGWLSLKQFALILITFGLYYPYALNNEYAYLARTMYYGDKNFAYNSDTEPPFSSYARAYLLGPFTLWLSFFWFSAAMQRHATQSISLGELRFSSTVTGGRLLGRTLINYLILLLSAGLLYPLLQLRDLRYLCNTLSFSGEIDFATITQSESSSTATSEAVVEILGFE